MNLAPIILFVYNRPWHTKQTLDALKLNNYANQSVLYIYCDGPKVNASDETLKGIEEVRVLIREKKWCKKIFIVERTENLGLANSVIKGVTEVIEKHGKVIVLEDDIITSPNFVSYMNNSLKFYEREVIVKQISAFAFDLKFKKSNRAYFMPITTTWGWGTWKRVWDETNFNPQDYLELKANEKLCEQFNLEGSYDYTSMMIAQMEGQKVSSWGIRFWWNVFKNKGLVLHPDYSLVQNIGFDNSGVHCDNSDFSITKNWNSEYEILNYPDEISIDQNKFKQLKVYLKNNLHRHKSRIKFKDKWKRYLLNLFKSNL